MTWHPLQAALKMSTIPGAIRATLDVLLDHINADPQDPGRPDTLTVWESRERLADETGFSEVTIWDHLKRLRGEKALRPGQRVTLLRCTEPAQSHRAARYELIPEALDALADQERVKAFAQGAHRPTHPYQRWRDWREAQMAEAEGGESCLPQDPADEPLGVSALPQTAAVGVSAFPQFGQAAYPEFPVVDQEKKELTRPDAPAAPIARAPDEPKAEAQSPYWCGDCGYATSTCDHRTIVARPSARPGGLLTLVRHALIAVNPAPG
jgi:hypothetical protein